MITESSLAILGMGAFFGLTAGISPGPLLTLVITETIKHNRREGIRIAFAPLFTDLPIILVSSFVFSRIAQFNLILSLISFLGGIYFIYLGYETFRTKGLAIEVTKLGNESIKKGIAANLLNPNPYIFWLTVGIPAAFKAYAASLVTVIFYFLLFYLLLIGSKIIIAILVEKSKAFLKQRSYRLTMQVLGSALLIFALYFFYDGIKILQGIVR